MTTPTNTIVTWFVRIGYLGVIALATLSDLRFEPDLEAARARLGRALQPTYAAKDVVDAARNLALFAGWGALWAATSKSVTAFRTILAATMIGASFSLVVEGVQLFSSFRNTSILDVITNSLGALAGAVTIIVMIRVAARHRHRDSYLGIPSFTFAGAYFVASMLFALAVVRPNQYRDAWGGPQRRFSISLEHFDWSHGFNLATGAEALIFVPLGFLAVTALREARWGVWPAAYLVAAFGLVATSTVEAARGLLGLEMNAGAAAAHGVGVLMGALAAAFGLPRLETRLTPARAAALAGTFYTAVVLAWSWKPFLPETNWQLIREQLVFERLVPLTAHAWRVDFFGVSDIGAGFSLYLPLGALLAAWPLRQTGPLSGIWPGLYIAVISEVGQIIVAGRYFESTDMLVQCAGVLLGWVMMRQAGFRSTPNAESLSRVLVTPAPGAS